MPTIEVKIKHNITDIVYITTDPEQLDVVVTGFLIKQDSVMYVVSFCGTEQEYYDYELTSKRDMAKVLGVN